MFSQLNQSTLVLYILHEVAKEFCFVFYYFSPCLCFYLVVFIPFCLSCKKIIAFAKYTRRQNNAKSLYELYFQVKTKNLFISSIVRLEPCKALWRHWLSRGRLLLFVSFFGARTSLISIFILFVVVCFSSSFPLQVILLKGDILVQNIYLYFLVWTVWFKSHCSGGDVSSNLSF